MRWEQLNADLRSELDLMLTLKMKDFRSNQMRNITRDHLLDYLFNVKWKRRDKIVTCDIVNDIFDVTAHSVRWGGFLPAISSPGYSSRLPEYNQCRSL